MTRAPGYVVVGDVDVGRFRQLVATARKRHEDGDLEPAVAQLKEALALWRGPPLADFAYEAFAASHIERLEEERIAALEERIELELELGRHARLVGELEELCRAYSLRERLHELLMLALYRSGRQSEALQVYAELRQRLVEELGLDPGASIQAFERRILQQDPTLEAPADKRQTLPDGTVTFLFTDIEESTRLLHELGAEAYARALAEHRKVLRTAFAAHAGVEVDTQGDAFFVAFPTAPGALAAATEAQAELADGPLRVRMALHTGTPLLADEGYVGVDVHRAARIAAAGHGGQVLVSETTQRLVEQGFELRDLGLHGLKDITTPQRLYQLGAGEFPPLRSLNQTNLPVQPTPLVGRERELGELEALIEQSDVRLVTLTGAGGSGKTRLGLELALRLLPRFPDGVVLVELAAITDPDLFAATLAQALAVREQPPQSLEDTLIQYLGGRRMLVVLDNFEQLLAAAPQLATLLAGCQQVRALVTSRAALHLAAEREYPVPPLALPITDPLPALEQLSQYEAVALFVARARAVKPDFAVTNQNARAVAEICVRLDGLPLALELAAARVRALTPEAMLHRLGERLRLLTGGPRDRPERQQTLRAAIAWSYELLSDAEKTLFARLAVFRGGRTLEAIETVCADEEVTQPDLLDGVEALIDNNLLRREETSGAEPRYVMLETIHEFAHERLADRGELQAVSRRHAEYYLSLAEAGRPELDGAGAGSWLARLEYEHDNLRAAIEFLGSSGAVGRELRLAVSLRRFWELRGHLGEGHRILADAVERLRGDSAVPVDTWEQAVTGLAVMTHYLGRPGAAVPLFEEALASARGRGDEERASGLHINFAYMLSETGDHRRSLSILERLLASGRLDKTMRAYALLNCTIPLVALRRAEEAQQCGKQALELYGALGIPEGVCLSSSNLGYIELLLDGFVAAEDHFRQALRLSIELGSPLKISYSLLGLAAVRAGGTCGKDAARLAGASERILETIGARYETLEGEARERTVKPLRQRLGEEAFSKAYAEGKALSVEQAIALAEETEQ